MKRKSILTILVASAMMIVGCNKNGGPSAPDIPLEEFVTAIEEGILETQTYSTNIKTRYKGDNTDTTNFNMYCINDDAIFDDSDPYFYNGYIRQKNQGIVDFQMLQNGAVVMPGEFYATDPEMKIHDFYPAAPSNVFSHLDGYAKVKKNIFKSEDTYAMAVIANLGLGIYAMRVMNPEYFTVTINKDHSKVVVNAEFIDNFQSEEPGALPDTFIQIPVNITLTFTDIGISNFPSIEGYVANPDYVYPTPTSWSETDLEILKRNFNDVAPMFVPGLSYAYEVQARGVGNNYYALLIDYASGDLTNIYGALLTDFEKIGESTYQKAVDDELRHAKYTYQIQMKFYDPDDVMDPKTGEKWGFCYPNGVFEAKFSYSMSLVDSIKTLQDLSSYLEVVDVARFFQFDDVNAATEVKNFEDGTVLANQREEGDIFHFYAPTGYKTFRVKFSFDDAVKFYAAQEEYMEECGDLSRSSMSLAHTVMWSTNDTFTVFQYTQVSDFNESTYPGYVEIRVAITYDFYEAHKNDERPEKFKINYMVLNQDDEDVTSDALSKNSVLPFKVVKNTTVNVFAQLNNGYTFKQYEPVEPEEGPKTVQEQIISGTFIANIPMSSFVAPNYDFTMVIRVEELDPSIHRLESISVIDLTTEYRVGGTYSFDGKVIANYSDGGYDVTSQATIVDGNVNTSVEDVYVISISFVDEYGQSAYTTVKIYVRANPTYRINVKPVDGVTIQVTYPTSGQSAPESEVRFKVTEGEDLLHDIKVFTVSAIEISVDYRMTFQGKQYYFEMPEEDVVITPIKASESVQLEGSYSTYVELATVGYYNKYTLTFNSDGTGTYVREWHNGNPTTYTLYFSYVVKGSNITVKLEGFKDSADNSSFVSGYRLFVSSKITDPEDPEWTNTNPTGVINDNYSVKFSLVNSDGDIVNIIDFYRE